MYNHEVKGNHGTNAKTHPQFSQYLQPRASSASSKMKLTPTPSGSETSLERKAPKKRNSTVLDITLTLTNDMPVWPGSLGIRITQTGYRRHGDGAPARALLEG